MAAGDVEGGAVDDPRDGRAEQHRPRQRRMPVEQLRVVVEILVEVATADQRPADRTERVHREARGEHDDEPEAALDQPLERGKSFGEALSRAGQAYVGFRRT